MNPYEGLQLSQLLDRMHDLVRPEPIAWTPQTVGWAVVVLWLLAVVLLVTWHRIQVWRRNRYRREALAELRRIRAQQDLDPQSLASQVAGLLKRTALAAYPRNEVADLYGSAWAEFLCESSANDKLVNDNAEALGSAAYRRDSNGAELLAPARRWIKVHRV